MTRWSALVLPLLAGCQSSYLAARGDAALERGDHALALANYTAALERAPEDDQVDIEARKLDAAVLVVRGKCAEADQARAEGRLEDAFALLGGVIAAGAWGASTELPAVVSRLDGVARAMWSEVDALAAKRWHVRAVERAEQIVAPLPSDHELRRRAALVRSYAIGRHVELAAETPPGARLFHLRLAAWLGAHVSEPINDAVAGAQREIDVAWTIVARTKPDCAWIEPLVAQRAASGGRGAPLAVEYTIDRCASREERWTASEVYSLAVAVPHVETASEPYYEWVPLDPSCTEPECTRWDELGMCIGHAPEREECSRRERRLAHREVERTRFHTVSSTRARDVRHRRLNVELDGKLAIRTPDGLGAPISRPIAVRKRHDDRSYWSPAEWRLFDGMTLEVLHQRAADDVAAMLRSEAVAIRRVNGQRHAELAARAEEAGRVEDAASGYVLAATAGTPSGRAEPFFARHYGLRSGELDRVLQGASFVVETALPPAQLPAAERTGWQEAWTQRRVRSETDAQGLAAMEEDGLDLSFTVAQSALAAAERLHGISMRARFERFHLLASLGARSLGGQSGGFGLGIAGVGGDLDDEGYYLSWGLEYRQEQAGTERQQGIYFPIWIGVPLTRWLALQVGVAANTFILGEIGQDGPPSAHHYSPAFVRLQLDLAQRVLLEVGATHHLGIGFDDPVHFDAALGVRL